MQITRKTNELYRQQQEMFDQKIHRIDFRIVSISQPNIIHIVRGKASAKVEFGAKVFGFDSHKESFSIQQPNETQYLAVHSVAFRKSA